MSKELTEALEWWHSTQDPDEYDPFVVVVMEAARAHLGCSTIVCKRCSGRGTVVYPRSQNENGPGLCPDCSTITNEQVKAGAKALWDRYGRELPDWMVREDIARTVLATRLVSEEQT